MSNDENLLPLTYCSFIDESTHEGWQIKPRNAEDATWAWTEVCSSFGLMKAHCSSNPLSLHNFGLYTVFQLRFSQTSRI